MIIEYFALFFSLVAYYQVERKNFLIINSIVIFFIGLSFYMKGSYGGAIIEGMMFLIHLLALFISKEKEKIIKLFAIPIAFLVALYFTDNGYSLFLAIAISFFVLGVFQEKMILNKISFIVGLSFLAYYSFSIETYIICFSNIIGILVLIFSIFRLKGEK